MEWSRAQLTKGLGMTPKSDLHVAAASASAGTADRLGSTTELVRGPREGLASATEDRTSKRVRRGRVIRRALVAADIAGLLTAFAVTELLFRNGSSTGIGAGTETVIFVLTLPAWLLAAKLYGLYDRDEELATHSTSDELVSLFHLVTVVVWLYYSLSWFLGLVRPDQAKLATFWLLSFVGLVAGRSAARSIARRRTGFVQNAVVVGAGDVGQLIGRKLNQHPEYRMNLVGYVDATPREFRRDVTDVQLLGEPDEIVDIVRQHDVDRVILAFSKDGHDTTLQLITALQDQDVQIDVVPRLYEAVGPKTVVHWVEGLPLIGLTPARIPRLSRIVKRGLDVVGASILLALMAPLMLVIAVLIRHDSPGPVFFRQVRIGMNLREFTMLKFRTMREGTDDAPHREYLTGIMSPEALPAADNLYKLDRSDVITHVGGWLRRMSLDELPQLINVLRGDMSLVGPRPSIPYELTLLEPHHFERFNVPAGVTGLWQVEARAHSTFGEALDLDVLYARSWSLGLDLRLLLRTPALIFKGRETS
jgi:exopolysaccharide biosynthesis polyprenyl glycosylphosphotransferase